MPFFSDYGFYHGSVPFSSQYYSQLLPFTGVNSGRPRVQPRSYNSMAVEQTLRAIRRGTAAVAARHYSRPVHINASEIDVTSPRRPRRQSAASEAEAKAADLNEGGNIHRGRTVVRLHTKKKWTEKPPTLADAPSSVVTVVTPAAPQELAALPEEGLAKKGTIKRHTSAGIKVPVNDDRRPSVTDEILREQEALFDTMIMEEMEVQKDRRKSYPADVDDVVRPQRAKGSRKKSAAAALAFGFTPSAASATADPEKPARRTNWKLNYDVIIEENGTEPVSFTFKLNKAKKESFNSGGGAVGNNGKLDANHNVVLKSHDDKNNKKTSNKKHVKSVSKKQTNNDSDDVCMSEKKTKVVKKKIIVKKKVVKKKEGGEQQDKQTPSPPELKKNGSKTETPATVTPFVRASFGKTFISPLQVSKTKSKFEKPKPKLKTETSPPPPPPPSLPPAPPESSDDESSSSEEDDDSSSLCSDESGSSSGSTYYDSDDYGDKRIACSISSFDSGLPPSPAFDPIGITITTTTAMIFIT